MRDLNQAVSPKIRLVIFDLDGTLLNTLKDLWVSTNYSLTSNGFPERTMEEVRCFVGNGIRTLIKRALPYPVTDEVFEKIFVDFKAHYKVHCNDFTGPYEGIMELLKALKDRGYTMGIASNKLDPAVEQLRKEWVPRLIAELKQFDEIRLGLLLYRDYPDNFRFKGLPVRFFDFTYNIKEFEANLNAFIIKGTEGGDIPEAVYEAMYASLEFYKWDEDAQRKIILIGDAEPHPKPRGSGKYSKDLVMKLAAEKEIAIDAIITPDDKGKRGR